MRKNVMVSLVLLTGACSRVSVPLVPKAAERGAANAKPSEGPGAIYAGEEGEIGSIAGTLPSDADKEPLKSGETSLPKVDLPKETEPKSLPSDMGTDPRTYRTISVVPSEDKGRWEGFGANLGAWANAVGASDYQDTYADLLFTAKNTAFANTVLPGLALNIVRYGIGGSGKDGDVEGVVENNPQDFAAFRDIDGYWIGPGSDDPMSMSFDWTRDAHQRAMMLAAKDRGVGKFEFYALAPMWWMTAERSSVGGRVDKPAEFAKYLSAVTQYARDEWKIPVSSLAPFNEPSSDRWHLNANEQGTALSSDRQAEMLTEIQKEFLAKNLSFDVALSGSDEATPKAALSTHASLQQLQSDLYEKLNVHTADRGRASRDVAAKAGLRAAVGNKRIWVSDHSDNESDAMNLAMSIVEDIRTLKATAWIYGMPVDNASSRGLLIGDFDMSPTLEGVRGKPKAISVKHYILAQFSRFIRPGQTIVGGGDDKSLLAYDASTRRLSVVILNPSRSDQDVEIDLSAFRSFSTSITHVSSRGDGMKLWKAKSVGVLSRKIRVNIEASSVSSLEIPETVLK